jgi:hypothetical protein
MRKCVRYPAIASFLIPLFLEYRDRSEAEAGEILRRLSHVPESAPLFIYFAVYRKAQYGGGFNPAPFERFLEGRIRNGSPSLRAQLAWNLGSILRERPEDFASIQRYIDSLVGSADSGGIIEDHLVSIVKDSMALHPQEALSWFIQLLRRRLEARPGGQPENQPATTFHFYKEVMEGIARQGDVQRFMEALELIVHLLERDAHTIVYDIKEIFQASQLLQDPTKERGQTLDRLWSSLRQSRSWISPNWKK